MSLREITKYLYEMGQLKRVMRSGWWIAGVSQPESVAEHSFRTAILGYILAQLEGADPLRVATMCLFHDTPEARTNDTHKVAARYIKGKDYEEKAFLEQLERLPQNVSKKIEMLMDDYENGDSLEAKVAHDSDLLECILQAREYQVQGYVDVQDWIDNCQAGLVTDSAKGIAVESIEIAPSHWWQGLKALKKSNDSEPSI